MNIVIAKPNEPIIGPMSLPSSWESCINPRLEDIPYSIEFVYPTLSEYQSYGSMTLSNNVYTYEVVSTSFSEIKTQILSQVSNISRSSQDQIVRSAGKAAEYSRNIEIINSPDSTARSEFLLAKSISFAGWKSFEPDMSTLRYEVLLGGVTSFCDYVLDANNIAAQAGDAIVNERGRLVQLINAATTISEIKDLPSAFQDFCNTKLYVLSKRIP